MKMNRNNQFMGYLLITFGVLFLIGKLANFSLVTFWPIFLLLPGIAFHLFYLLYQKPGLLIPGGILTTYGLLFFFSEFTTYRWMEYLWPVFILGPAIGLFEFYLLGGRKNGVLIAAVILFIVGGTFLCISLISTFIPYLLSLVLIVSGLYLLFGKRTKQKSF